MSGEKARKNVANIAKKYCKEVKIQSKILKGNSYKENPTCFI